MPLTIEDVPESLHEWARLNDEYERKENDLFPTSETASGWTDEQRARLRALEAEYYPRIEEAWNDAPLFDRMRVDWRMLKQVWRERHDKIQGGAA